MEMNPEIGMDREVAQDAVIRAGGTQQTVYPETVEDWGLQSTFRDHSYGK